jgi:hypothetical protein
MSRAISLEVHFTSGAASTSGVPALRLVGALTGALFMFVFRHLRRIM